MTLVGPGPWVFWCLVPGQTPLYSPCLTVEESCGSLETLPGSCHAGAAGSRNRVTGKMEPGDFPFLPSTQSHSSLELHVGLREPQPPSPGPVPAVSPGLQYSWDTWAHLLSGSHPEYSLIHSLIEGLQHAVLNWRWGQHCIHWTPSLSWRPPYQSLGLHQTLQSSPSYMTMAGPSPEHLVTPRHFQAKASSSAWHSRPFEVWSLPLQSRECPGLLQKEPDPKLFLEWPLADPIPRGLLFTVFPRLECPSLACLVGPSLCCWRLSRRETGSREAPGPVCGWGQVQGCQRGGCQGSTHQS